MRSKEKEVHENILQKRMYALGWNDPTTFARESKIKISAETVRRAIKENRQSIGYGEILILMRKLDFTPQEIAEELERRGDTEISAVIRSASKASVVLSDREKKLIKAVRDAKVGDALHAVFSSIIHLISVTTPQETKGGL